MIYTVTLNPALDKTAQIPDLKVDEVNRIVELRRDAGGKGINVSKVVKELGGVTEAWAVLAGNTGAWVQSALEADGIRVNATLAEGETRTNLKVVDPVNDTHTDINEPGPEVTDSKLNDMPRMNEVADECRKIYEIVAEGSSAYIDEMQAAKQGAAQETIHRLDYLLSLQRTNKERSTSGRATGSIGPVS